ncbi:MAG TPA: PQQ-dependent sugar dehydrogenase [Pedobacter sp.]
MKKIVTLICCLFFLSACEKNKGNDTGDSLPDADLKTEVLTQSLIYPWDMVYGPDSYIWFTERAGKISRLNPKNGVITLVHTISEVNSIGEGGLLGMALDPRFSTNPYLYVVYDYGTGTNYKGKVVRFTFNNGVLTDPLVLLDQIPASANHNGSRLLITPDQKLFITTGDANTPANAQDTASLSGKILRINLDGTIPADNPFPNNPVWSYGHRNPQGLVLFNNQMYASEHGADTDDEVNLIQKGKNYGWPNIQGYCNTTEEKVFCAANDVTEPLMAWTPTIAPSGLTYYNSDYIPQWRNSLLMVTLKGTRLLQLQLNDTGDKIDETDEFFLNQFGRLRAVCQSPDGKVYLATSNGTSDKIIEVSVK